MIWRTQDIWRTGLIIAATLTITTVHSHLASAQTVIEIETKFSLADFTTAAENDTVGDDSPAEGGAFAGPLYVRERANEANPELEVEAFLRFDLSGLTGDEILNARLELNENNKLNSVNSADLFLAQVLEAWDSSGNDPVFAEETTPNDGAGGITDVTGEFLFGNNGPASAGPSVSILHSIDVLSFVKQWQNDPASNFGVRIRIDDAFVGAAFDDTGPLAPMLFVTQSIPVPEPATVLIAALGLLGMGWLGRRRRKRS